METKADITKYAAVIIKDGKWLIVKDTDQDFWKNVGGLCEEGETPEECLTREVQEELGVNVTQAENYFSLPITETVTEPKRNLAIHVYKVEIEGEPTPCGETGEIHWLSKAEFESKKFNLAMQITEYIAPRLIKDGVLK